MENGGEDEKSQWLEWNILEPFTSLKIDEDKERKFEGAKESKIDNQDEGSIIIGHPELQDFDHLKNHAN